ncbi:MAG TPA: hypothetical protein VLE49_08910, partial [Anaerolineales bacterium]|nr:hypothetical protein [Anaerolineales bacterium]
LFFLYLLFNLALSDNPMPNTFYAKQAEYWEYWSSQTVTARVSNYLWPILASPFLVLIPAAIVWLVKTIRARNWGVLASLIWVLGYIGIYFTRLPAYQHGRYIIPALPILYLWGVVGLLELSSSPRINKRLISFWQVTTVVLTMVFQFVGARQNAYDVFLIESEMTVTAKWVAQNLPRDARLAVHDIGVLGFYVQNPLIDMAGILTPQVVPIIRNEPQLAKYLDSNSVDYLITFPGFYPQLTSQRESVFKAGDESGPLQFDENMEVFRWK